jgi:predicted nucleic acid binding AN1-type Zn finger protein
MTEFQQKIKKNDVKIRCNVCNKKINMTFIECKCGKFLCLRHRYAENHDCKFDYKTAWSEKLRNDNPVVIKAKIIKI